MAGLEARMEDKPQHAANRLGDTMATKKKDLPASKDVKGGKPGLTPNDNLTLVRAAKPAKKDLPVNKDIKGGKKATRLAQ